LCEPLDAVDKPFFTQFADASQVAVAPTRMRSSAAELMSIAPRRDSDYDYMQANRNFG
jgi:hypothetical protein